jgi:putative FmdB family regulatory protein
MPLYEYECDACGKRFEKIQKFSDPAPDRCEQCGSGPVRKLLSSPAIQFKGSGWYITDYANKGKSDPAAGKSKDSGAATADSAGKSAASEGTTKTDGPAAAAAAPAAPAPAKKSE